MKEYNLSTEEITKVIALYSKITSPEKRIYAQGYLNGLGDMNALLFSQQCNDDKTKNRDQPERKTG